MTRRLKKITDGMDQIAMYCTIDVELSQVPSWHVQSALRPRVHQLQAHV